MWASAAASRGRISRGSWALGHGLPCSEACEIFLDLPGPGIEPASPALQAAFAPEPPVRSQAAQIVTVWPDCTLQTFVTDSLLTTLCLGFLTETDYLLDQNLVELL